MTRQEQIDRIKQLLSTNEQSNIELAYQIAKGMLKMSDVDYTLLRLEVIKGIELGGISYAHYKIHIKETSIFRSKIAYWLDSSYFITIHTVDHFGFKRELTKQLESSLAYGQAADEQGRKVCHEVYMDEAINFINHLSKNTPIIKEVKPVLHLNLKKQWFDLIASGAKKQEYREVKEYWSKRFDVPSGGKVKIGSKWYWAQDVLICFKNGYKPNAPEMLVECSGLSLSAGKLEWGAQEGIEYYTLELSSIISIKNL